MNRTFASALALLLANPAAAASDAAMARGEADARRACLKAADLAGATVVAAPVLFSDTAGKTALLVNGRWRQPHMKNARATMLCLYDRRHRTAEAQEAAGWSVRR